MPGAAIGLKRVAGPPRGLWPRLRRRLLRLLAQLAAHDLRHRLARLAEAERLRAPLLLPCFIVAGVLFYFTLKREPPPLLAPALALTAGGACLWLARRGAAMAWLAVPALLAALALGVAAAGLASLRAPPLFDPPHGAAVLVGRIVAIDTLAATRPGQPSGRRVMLDHVRLAGAADPLARRIRVRLCAGDNTPIAAGDTLSLRALLFLPWPPAYPGAWDQQRDAFYAGLGAGGFALGPVTRLAAAPPGWGSLPFERLREAITRHIAAIDPGPAGAIATTLLTGAQGAIPPADRDAFRAAGLAHLLAVAGLHIGIVMGLVLMLARWGLRRSEYALLHWPVRAIAALCALAAGLFYLLLTGAHLPILRSFMMATLFTLAVLAGRRAASLRGLMLAAGAMALVLPQDVPGVSFQMSFAAVLSLIAGYAALRPWFDRLAHSPHGASGLAASRGRRLLAHAAMLALTSLFAGSAAIPFGIYHFGRLQPWFVPANMLAVPLTAAWVLPAGLLGLVLMPFGLDGPAFWLMTRGTALILVLARAVAALPAASLAVPHMPGLGLCAAAAGLIWLCLWRTLPLRLLGLPAIVLGLASPWLATPPAMFVSGDARLAAMRLADGTMLAFRAPGGARFTLDAWARYWGDPAMILVPAGPHPKPPTRTVPGLSCDPRACTLRLGGMRVMVLRGPGQWAAQGKRRACPGIDVLVALMPPRGACPGVAIRLDRAALARSGAVALWPGPPPRLSGTEAARGTRPWVPPPVAFSAAAPLRDDADPADPGALPPMARIDRGG